jgi:hypothetical protein
MRLTLVAAFLVAAGLIACSPPPQRESLAGTIDTLAHYDLAHDGLLALAPCDQTTPTFELRFPLERALDRLGFEISDQAPLRLVYCTTIVFLDVLDGYLPDIALAGTIGSSGSSDIGVGIGIPVLGANERFSRYRFEITTTIKDREGLELWSGRAAGAAGLYTVRALVRTVAPLLIERLGTSARQVPFSDRAY